VAANLAPSLSTLAQGLEFLPPLRVLTLAPFYPSQENPAQGCFIAEPLEELKSQAVNSDVIAVQPFYRAGARPLAGNAPARWQKYFSFPGNFGLPLSGRFAATTLFRQVQERHRRESYDLIHAHSALPCGEAALTLSERLGIPFIVTVHGLDAYSTLQAGPVLGKWCARISKRVYESASAVICISGKVRDQVAQIADARTIVIHNGVDTSLFSPGTERRPLTILSVGNLIPVKGHATLLGAFAGIQKFAPDCALDIIGEGSKRDELKLLAANLGIADRVRFLGRQSRADVADAMRHCAVFALPSSYEGLGCVYLEAMASGKPAIGCHGQGIDEIIESERNGFLVIPNRESELSDCLMQLLRDEKLRRCVGAAARETVLTRHSMAHQAAHLANVDRECTL
jgi:glycosyltransferase involved in cell wall biosynthesis